MMQVWKWSHYAMVEDVEPNNLYPTSMSYIFKMFKHFKQLWMGIWQNTHTVITTNMSPDLGQLAEILDDVSVVTILLCYGWGCSTFQISLHIHVIHIQGIWAPLIDIDGHMADTHTVTTTVFFLELRELAKMLDDVRGLTMPLRYGWGHRTFQTASHIHVIHI